jgi:hypothetical protein
MSQILQAVLELVARQEVVVSDHGYDELAADDILVHDILLGVRVATVIEDYPTYYRDRVSSSYKRTSTVSLCMWCGASR